MNTLRSFSLLAVSALFSCQAFATSELYVWEETDDKSQGILEAVADFERLYDCKVKIVEVDFTEQMEKFNHEGIIGNGPDILLCPSDKVGAAVVQGMIAPISFMQEDQDKYIRSAVTAFSQNGEIYGVPKVVETLVMYYNKDYLKEPFDTLEEYFDYSNKVISEGNGQYGLLAKWDNLYYYFGAIEPYGAYVFGIDSDGNVDAADVGLSNSGAIEGMTMIKKFYSSGVFPKETLGESGINVITNMFCTGKAVAVIDGPWRLEPFAKAGINFGVTPLPVLPNGKPMSSFLGVKGYVISSYCKDRELAEKYLQFINQPKYAKRRYETTLEIPPVKAVMADPVITNDETANAVAVQASRAVPIPSIPEMSEVWGPIDQACSEIISGKKSVKDGLKSATEHINYQIEAFRAGM